jgi:class 3 adenylate cyclase
LIQKHHEAVRSALLDCGGQEVKTTGDGFLASFVSVESAVRCAREIQRGFDSMRPDANFRYWSELVWAQANPSLKMETCSGRW